jgi:hypothetical protein
VPKPVAIWNSARDVWETPQTEGLFCEHLDVYSETFPTSGMTLNGVAYELPTWEPATPDLGYSFLPDDRLLMTPVALEARKATMLPSQHRKDQGHQVWLTNQIRDVQDMNIKTLPTPTTSDTNGAGKHGDGGLDLRTAVALLSTGEITDLPSHGGKQSWEDVPLPLPS